MLQRVSAMVDFFYGFCIGVFVKNDGFHGLWGQCAWLVGCLFLFLRGGGGTGVTPLVI